ncbi:hypothetical protein NT26_1064 [Pseudorhizobium banfieldiae]|uniref:Uncharacterized protein n=1 Tax=Pseudorhizobium banfieldiae TaxID=1125847 RepID=L0NCG3_9HYPH|nr:hypothetical protein NT26_1064 [Pseudorhizobium banfieldiae]
MLLQGVDEIFLEIIRRQGLVGDLAQRNDRVLVVVAVHRDRRTLGDLTCTMAGQKHELKAVVDFIDAIFYGDTGHCLSFAVVISGIQTPDTGIDGRIQVFPDQQAVTSPPSSRSAGFYPLKFLEKCES